MEVRVIAQLYARLPLTCHCTFDDPRDADDAMYYLDRTRFHGRELEVEVARGDRKCEYQLTYKYPHQFTYSPL